MVSVSLTHTFSAFTVFLMSLCFSFLTFVFLSVQEALGEESMSDCVLSFVEMLLPVLLGLLKGFDPAQGDSQMRKHCHRITHVTNLLLNILYLTCAARLVVCICVFLLLLKP